MRQKIIQMVVVVAVFLLLIPLMLQQGSVGEAPYDGVGRTSGSEFLTWKDNMLYYGAYMDENASQDALGLYSLTFKQADSKENGVLLAADYLKCVNVYGDDIYYINQAGGISRLHGQTGKSETFQTVKGYGVCDLLIVDDWLYWIEVADQVYLRAYELLTEQTAQLAIHTDKDYGQLFAYKEQIGCLTAEGEAFVIWDPVSGKMSSIPWRNVSEDEMDTSYMLYGFLDRQKPVYVNGDQILVSEDFGRTKEKEICNWKQMAGESGELVQVLVHPSEVLISVRYMEDSLPVYKNYVYRERTGKVTAVSDSASMPQEWNSDRIIGADPLLPVGVEVTK